MNCSLCGMPAESYFKGRHGEYFQCRCCRGVFLSSHDHLDPEAELARYWQHNNDVLDPGYQEFVSPITDHIERTFGTESFGLDYGCGPGPVISHLLRKAGYNMNLYDPMFEPDRSVLEAKYEFIVCSEVIEHFRSPAEEFQNLRSYLEPGGELICMTDLLTGDTDFANWYYKDDSTHVFFYTAETVEFISQKFGFSNFMVDDRLMIFEN